MGKLIDLSDRIVGKLKVLGIDFYRKGYYYWKCLCLSCGEECSIRGDHIRKEETKACRRCGSGWRRKNLKGQRFGRYLVLEFAGLGNKGSYEWKAICDCGNIKTVRGSQLRNGTIKSCGCLQKEVASSRLTIHGLSKTKEYKAWAMQNRQNKDSSWTLLMDIALRSMFSVCINCGGTDRLATDHVLPISAGFGLYPGNAVRLCIHCNASKSNKLPDQLPSEFRGKILQASERFRIAWSGGF